MDIIKKTFKDIQKERASTQGVNPFSKNFAKISHPSLINIGALHPSITKFRGNLKVVLISLPEISQIVLKTLHATTSQKPIKDITTVATQRRLCSYSKNFTNYLYECYIEAIQYSVNKYNANIICINELGLPLNRSGLSASSKAIKFARGIADSNKCIIIGGSVHDYRSQLNTSYIFTPGKTIKYFKQVSATQECEYITVPPLRQTYSIGAFGISISTLLCLDLADFSSVISAVKGQDYSPHLLFVPAYSKYDEPLERLSITISKALSGGVIFVNFFHKEKPSHFIYMYGEDNPKSPIKTKLFPTKQDPQYSISLYKFDLDLLSSFKRGQKSLDEDTKWLFGLKEAENIE